MNGNFLGGMVKGMQAASQVFDDAARVDHLRAQTDELKRQTKAKGELDSAVNDYLTPLKSGGYGIKPPDAPATPRLSYGANEYAPASVDVLNSAPTPPANISDGTETKPQPTPKAKIDSTTGNSASSVPEIVTDNPAVASPKTEPDITSPQSAAVGTASPLTMTDSLAAPKAALAPAAAPGLASPSKASDADWANFNRNARSRIVAAYIRDGKPEHAKAFMDFARSEDGERYSRDWLASQRAIDAGDYEGALAGLSSLYNRERPDGRTMKITSVGDGLFQADHIDDATGQVVASKVMAAPDLAQLGLSALSPAKHLDFLLQGSREQRKSDLTQNRQEVIEDIRNQRAEEREDRRDARQVKALEAIAGRQDKSIAASAGRQDKSLAARQESGTTLSQDRQNAEIQAARDRISSMTYDDIRRKSQKFSATGRENPDFDPSIAHAASLAGRRMIGDDPAFDARQPLAQPAQDQPGANAFATASAAFSANPAMKGYKLGEQTPQGFKVFDPQGRHVGYFGKQ